MLITMVTKTFSDKDSKNVATNRMDMGIRKLNSNMHASVSAVSFVEPFIVRIEFSSARVAGKITLGKHSCPDIVNVKEIPLHIANF